MASISLRSIAKTFPGGISAVADFSLEVADKELFVLLGPSGCGKTTVLRLIAGLERVTSGAILLGGKDFTQAPAHLRKVAMLFQSPAVYPHMTVRQNLAFGTKSTYNPFDWWSRRSDRRVTAGELESAAQLLDLERLLNRKPAELSGGERQRVALGRALLRRPAVFLLDEPLAHGDPLRRLQLRRELWALQRRQETTLIWVTHDHGEALALADRIGVMEAGRLLQVGTPREVYERPATSRVAQLVGQPPMNLIAADLLEAEAGSEALMLGVRAQDIRIVESPRGIEVKVTGYEFGEPSGLAYLSTGRIELCACVPSNLHLDVGAKVRIDWEKAKVHHFDRQTGKRLPVRTG
jgi:ABC-type sugar transport system ATPase subunit